MNSLLCDWSMFSSAHLSLDTGKIRKNYLVSGGFLYDFTNHRRLFSVKIVALESLKRVTGRIFEINFKGAS